MGRLVLSECTDIQICTVSAHKRERGRGGDTPVCVSVCVLCKPIDIIPGCVVSTGSMRTSVYIITHIPLRRGSISPITHTDTGSQSLTLKQKITGAFGYYLTRRGPPHIVLTDRITLCKFHHSKSSRSCTAKPWRGLPGTGMIRLCFTGP